MARIFLILFSGLFFAFCMHTSPTEANPVFPAVPTVWYTKELVSLNGKPVHQQALGFDKKIILLENKNGLLPLNRLDLNIAHISIGGNSATFQQGMERFTHTESFLRTSISPEEMKEWMKDKALDMLIISVHATKDAKTDSLNTDFLKAIPDNLKTLLVVFGDESVLSKLPTKQFDGVLWAKENHQIAQDRTSQVLFGGLAITGKLSKEINTKDQVFMANTGFQTMTNGRLSFGSPEEIGIDSKKLKAIDEIANDGIEKGAYPGCQIVVAVNDHIIWRKCYGKQSYDQKAPSVKDEDVYDIASITKIAGSTLLAMHLQSQGKYELDKKLNEYIPELTGNSPFGNIVIRDMMAHQAGLTPFIPFYKKTMQNGEWNPAIYSKSKKDGFSKQVAEGMFMNDSYVDSMYAQILKSTLGPKKYEYSDLCYYFTQKILEKQIGQKQNVFLEANIYRPMGLRYMRYLPLNFFRSVAHCSNRKRPKFPKTTFKGVCA